MAGGGPDLDVALKSLRPPKGDVSVVYIDSGGRQHLASTHRRRQAMFEWGSLTKTITATLLAVAVVEDGLDLETTVGEILGDEAGRASGVTLAQLATHTSGLPRLSPNSMRMPFWPRDPYRYFRRARLIEGLAAVDEPEPGDFEYSNFGYDLLGLCLGVHHGRLFADAVAERIFEPLGMATARCQPCSRAGLARGHAGTFPIGGRRWHAPIPGAGGVDGSIDDLAAWARANAFPEESPLADALKLAQQVHAEPNEEVAVGLAWIRREGLLWHNGATGRYHGSLAIRPGQAALGALATHSPTDDWSMDGVIIASLGAAGSDDAERSLP